MTHGRRRLNAFRPGVDAADELRSGSGEQLVEEVLDRLVELGDDRRSSFFGATFRRGAASSLRQKISDVHHLLVEPICGFFGEHLE